MKEVTCSAAYEWTEGLPGTSKPVEPRRHVVVMDCGVKRNILRHLVSSGNRVTVVPAHTPADADPRALSPTASSSPTGPATLSPYHM